MIPDPGDPGLLHALPAFRRARGYRLYDGAARRYLDLWQADGHAILGHRPPGVTKLMKGGLSRGLIADLPSVRGGRLARALRSLLPGHPHVRVYAGLGRCLEALSLWRGAVVRVPDIPEAHEAAGAPVAASGRAMAVWRPFVDMGAAVAADVLVPVLPFHMGGSPWAVCFRDDPGTGVPASEPVSSVILEAAAAAVGLLARYAAGAVCDEIGRLAPVSWRRDGVYVSPRFPRERYPAVFRGFLDRGVVLSPRYDCPSILPAEASEGERAVLVGLFRAYPLE